MDRQPVRVGVIILIGVAAIAATLVLRSNNKKSEPEKGVAVVLAADASGAVTQTDDGVTRGYDRDGNVKWSQPPVIVKGPDGKQLPRITNFFCGGNCPDAYGNSAAFNTNRILKYGFGDDGTGQPLGGPFAEPGAVLRGAVDANTLIVRAPESKNDFFYVFRTPPDAEGESKELSERFAVKPDTAVFVLVSNDNKRVAALEAGGRRSGGSTLIRWFELQSGKWVEAGEPVTGERANACFSGDGERAALTGAKFVTMSFGGGNVRTLPVKGSESACTFSADGVTFSYTNPKNRKQILVSHYSEAGKQAWIRTFDLAAGFNPREGNGELFQVTDKNGTQLLNAANGSTVVTHEGEPAAFPAGNDIFVSASSKGDPKWETR